MKIKAVEFLNWCQGEIDAFCSILQIEENEAKRFINENEEFDPVI